MVKNMQIQLLKQMPDARAWLLIWINQLAALLGLQVVSLDVDVVREGWRQIPDGHQSFDPALAEHFKTLKMRNGKHINLAVSYSVLAKWNASNKRRGQPEWTYGSDRHYADKYTDVDRKTWGQHMEDLAALGLVEVSQMKGKPAYKVVPYQILNAQLKLVHAQGYGHDAQKHGRDAQGYGHDAHHITEVFITEESSKQNDLKPAPAPRAAAGLVQGQSSDAVVDEKPNAAVKAETVEAAKVDIQESPTPAAKPIPPVAASPLSHKWAGDDCDEPGMAGLRQFFTGCTDAELKQLVAKYGLAAIEQTIEAVRQLPNVENPPGLVKHKLLVQAVSTWTYPKKIDSQDAKNYVSGPYANFIRH